jgi:hypothetical protein
VPNWQEVGVCQRQVEMFCLEALLLQLGMLPGVPLSQLANPRRALPPLVDTPHTLLPGTPQPTFKHPCPHGLALRAVRTVDACYAKLPNSCST